MQQAAALKQAQVGAGASLAVNLARGFGGPACRGSLLRALVAVPDGGFPRRGGAKIAHGPMGRLGAICPLDYRFLGAAGRAIANCFGVTVVIRGKFCRVRN